MTAILGNYQNKDFKTEHKNLTSSDLRFFLNPFICENFILNKLILENCLSISNESNSIFRKESNENFLPPVSVVECNGFSVRKKLIKLVVFFSISRTKTKRMQYYSDWYIAALEFSINFNSLSFIFCYTRDFPIEFKRLRSREVRIRLDFYTIKIRRRPLSVFSFK